MSLSDLQDQRAGQRDAPTWALFRGMADGSALTDAGLAASRWALDVLERALGPSWPQRQFRARSWVPSFLLSYGAMPFELTELLIVATQMNAARHLDGFDEALSGVKHLAPRDQWWHLLLQLEVVEAAQAMGATASLEPAIAGSARRGDVELHWQTNAVVVETTTVTKADIARDHQRFEQDLDARMRGIADAQDVSLAVELAAHPADEVRDQLLAEIDVAASATRRTGVRHTVGRSWIRVVIDSVSANDAAATSGLSRFTGSVLRRDAWLRIRRTLRDKARQLAGASNVWIRLDVVDGLFSFTQWAQAPMNDRLDQLAHAILESVHDFTNVDGVILSSGRCAAFIDPDDPVLNDGVEGEAGVFIRRGLAPGMARETGIIVTNPAARETSQMWATAYKSEGTRLCEQLSQRGWATTRMYDHDRPVETG